MVRSGSRRLAEPGCLSTPGRTRSSPRGGRTTRVDAADGTDWRVRIVWRPRWATLAGRFSPWRRNRRQGGGTSSAFSGALDDTGDDLADLLVVFGAMLGI